MWPMLYAIMDDALAAHDNISEYVVSQATLEHVFIGFARLQETQDDSQKVSAGSSALEV